VTVLCFADTRFPIERANGAQTMATCCALARRGHQVTLVVRPDSAPVARDPFAFYGEAPAPSLRVTAVPVAGGPRARRVRFLLTALAIARADRHAVVFTRDLGLAALLLQRPAIRRPKVVYESHGVSSVVAEEMPRLLGHGGAPASPRKLRRLDRRERRVWSHAGAVVAITQALADDLAQRYGSRPGVHVVRDAARAQPGIPPPRPDQPATAGYAGHLYPWKGVDVFVRALALAPPIRGLIVGGHPQEADRDRVAGLVRELGLESRVDFAGLVPPGDVAGALAAATMLVLPNTRTAISERYTSPLKLFEYLAIGRPIVASDSPAIREVLRDGETAILVPPGEPQPLADALTRLSRDATLAAKLAAAARTLSASFTWEARAARLEGALTAAAAS
jgi:glycosyltransferase involved in cell wall biosynthesis